MRAGLRALRDAGDTTTFEGMDPDGPLPPSSSPTRTSPRPSTPPSTSSRSSPRMRAHATQIATDGPFFALSNNVGDVAWGVEVFRIAKGHRGPLNEDGLETDLFAGL